MFARHMGLVKEVFRRNFSLHWSIGEIKRGNLPTYLLFISWFPLVNVYFIGNQYLPTSGLCYLALHRSLRKVDMTSGLTMEACPNVDGVMTVRKKERDIK